MIRSTTNGTLAAYRFNLQRSTYTLNKSRDTVLSQRKFNSFAEDPAAAARSFQLRRSYLRTESQHTVGESVTKKYDVAWSTLDSVLSSVNQQIDGSAYTAIVKAESDTSAAGRTALGQTLSQMAESIVLTMNGRYGDNYVFSGADGLNIPFTWENGELYYRGISVDSAVPELSLDAANNNAPIVVDENGQPGGAGGYYLLADGVSTIPISDYEQLEQDAATLKYMSEEETKYVDLGLGLEKDADGNVMDSSAANVALQGINYLGYGRDADGDPKNLVSIISRMGEILQNCNSDNGDFAAGEKEEFYRLAEKFEDAAALLSDKHVELDAEARFLQGNQKQLESLSYTLNEQITTIEDVDLAEAITSFSWAQYCYNAALQAGNSILSQSLMDYLHT